MTYQVVPAVARTVSSASANEARARVLSLYRAWMREAPASVEKYALDLPVSQAKAKVRELFRANAGITDIKIIDLLVFKGKQNLDEAHNVWMQKTHIMRFFPELGSQPPAEKKTGFLDRFYAGHD
ncbi:NADH dehydrogenase 1 alpha subcomplex [Capsaspora owczarzaki ATCC 30864]|eukprot:XP_004349185.1 NADH dehydrogenase 1 alpha subcomplex [Capsaspora owczarzaki ATCC 30864]